MGKLPINGEDNIVVHNGAKESIDVGGTPFVAARQSIRGRNATLVAKGKSYLSYLFLGVCSSVLYLDPSANNDVVLFPDDDGEGDAPLLSVANVGTIASSTKTPSPTSAIAFEICYHKPVRASDFRTATAHFAGKNDGSLSEPVQRLIDEFNNLYRDVNWGDRYLLEYDPGRGLSLSWNGEHLGTVGGGGSVHEKEFARAVFSVWFGPEAFSDGMKRDLLTPIDPPVVFTLPPAAENRSRNDTTKPPASAAAAMAEEEGKLFKSWGIAHLLEEPAPTHSSSPFSRMSSNGPLTTASDEGSDRALPPSSSHQTAAGGTGGYGNILLGVGGVLFLFPHLAVMLSLPSVLRQRGAPYLPTFKNNLNITFDLVRRQLALRKKAVVTSELRFVDLGSGDGRVVFRAAREGFGKSTGYEINAALHFWASARRLIQAPKYWTKTSFSMRDLWTVNLADCDVIAVYGLNPIMERLGKKMKDELKPGAIVVSNVFTIPGWKAVSNGESGGNVHLYSVPDCWKKETVGVKKELK